MIRNGPKIRLSSAPGRRSTSVTSLPTNAVIRVQALSGPSNSSFMAVLRGLAQQVVLARCAFGARNERRKYLVEGWLVLTARSDAAAGGLDRLHDTRGGGGRVLGDDEEFARRPLANVAN